MPRRGSAGAVVAVVAGVVVFVVFALARPAGATVAGWRWPLAAPVTVVRTFAPPPEPWAAGHRGVDLAGSAGEAVRSAGSGVVRFAGAVAGVPVVSVGHPDGLLTTYEPVRPVVRPGQSVAAGQTLGRLVSAGSHCAPRACLHWGLRRGADYLDPLALLGLGRVRLLPDPQGGRGSWLVPAAGGLSIGSSSTVVAWAILTRRRRRRPLPPGVACIGSARGRRASVPARADPA